ncbi:MAG: chorismate synthase [Planctomycetota bacterium]
MRGLRWTTAGESHGRCLVAVLEGMPAGMALDLGGVDRELARRQVGYGRGGRMKIEEDRAELLSGTRGGITLGSPLAVAIANADFVIERLPVPANPRPGHADLAGCQKYAHANPRDVLERASARETAARVALGAIARQLLESFAIEIFAHVTELGGVAADPGAFDRAGPDRRRIRDASDLLSLDPDADSRIRERIDAARADGDSLGGVFEVRVLGLPPGLGGYANPAERLTGRLGGALLSIPAMKGVEFGLGFEAARCPGSAVHDPIISAGATPGPFGFLRRASNRAGGLEGGMTTGEPLVVRVAMKPIPSLRRGLPTVDLATGEAVSATYQRSDVTSVPAASVVGEAVVALELASAFREKFGGDSLDAVRDAFAAWRARIAGLGAPARPPGKKE